MTEQLGLFDIPSFSAINLPPRENRKLNDGQTKAKTKNFRLIKMREGGYYFIQKRVKSQWVDSDLPAYTDEVEAFIHFGHYLESEYKDRYNSQVSNTEGN